jgi:hypothetical protein
MILLPLAAWQSICVGMEETKQCHMSPRPYCTTSTTGEKFCVIPVDRRCVVGQSIYWCPTPPALRIIDPRKK